MGDQWIVTWESDVWAETPEDAAREALDMLTRPESIAHVFTVTRGGETFLIDLDGLNTPVAEYRPLQAQQKEIQSRVAAGESVPIWFAGVLPLVAYEVYQATGGQAGLHTRTLEDTPGPDVYLYGCRLRD